MEATGAASSGIPHTPITTVAGGDFVPPPPPSLVRTTSVFKPTTMGSGLIPLRNSTIFLFIQNASYSPLSYGIPGVIG
jgi:hypothetical protein